MASASRKRALLVDAAVAAGVGTAVALAAVRADEPGGRSPELAGWLLALATVGLLLVRRRFPVGVLAGLAVLTVGYNAAGFSGIGFTWPMLAGLYTAAAAGRLAVAVAVGAALAALDTGWLLLADRLPLLPVLGMALPGVVASGLAVALGDAVRSRRRLAAETREQLRRAAREREREVRRAVVEHRLRIAREIHDVTAHTLAVVAVQINVAADALPDEPAEASRALETAREVSREAMAELHGAVRVLRAPGEDPDGEPPMPAPRLADLPGLVDGYRGAGLTAVLREAGAPADVPAAVGLTAYRIVQEALANVARHAGAAHAEVAVEYAPGAVRVRVSDDGRGAGAGPGAGRGDGGGHGLAGLAERAAGVGGTLTAGPGPSGGWVVDARLPLGEGP
ncbi:sensor histidine kinase [Actinomadura sp. WAC 06369]|uniref:sensor histidine kinase n=1 Tax=Actinomadura sp. WAC 06369 TaxID=2203193 RepID=UPI000F76DC4C|nr:histidine kinase [Actinomadura sp. WAC 06369]RSN57645.1 sensor histidine kinase [Actinomadura sp. WAC 06369]